MTSTDTRITKTPVLTPEDTATIRKAAKLAALGPLSKQDLREFGILLYQMRASSEASRLAQIMIQMQNLPWE